MLALLIFSTGVTVALAAFYLARAVFGICPAFNRETVDGIGLVPTLAVYCCAGPVLLVRAFENAAPAGLVRTAGIALVFTILIIGWSGALGVFVMESASALLSPYVTS